MSISPNVNCEELRQALIPILQMSEQRSRELVQLAHWLLRAKNLSILIPNSKHF